MAEVKAAGALPDFLMFMPEAQPSAAPVPAVQAGGRGGIRNPEGKGGFVAGKSGNPGGTPKSAGEIKKLARGWSFLAIQRLVTILEDDDQPGSVHVAAANAMLDRGFGKPTQPVELGGPGAFDQMTDTEVREYALSRARMLTIEGTLAE